MHGAHAARCGAAGLTAAVRIPCGMQFKLRLVQCCTSRDHNRLAGAVEHDGLATRMQQAVGLQLLSTRPAISREQPTSLASSCRDTRSWVPCG